VNLKFMRGLHDNRSIFTRSVQLFSRSERFHVCDAGSSCKAKNDMELFGAFKTKGL
jgi:hypothetical protein